MRASAPSRWIGWKLNQTPVAIKRAPVNSVAGVSEAARPAGGSRGGVLLENRATEGIIRSLRIIPHIEANPQKQVGIRRSTACAFGQKLPCRSICRLVAEMISIRRNHWELVAFGQS